MTATDPWDVEQVRDRVGKHLAEFLSMQRPGLDDISPEVGSLVDRIAEFLEGGKRLRPMFLYWGWRAAGRSDCEPIITSAAAMEFLQACALIHDDVMDASDSRRGRPSMHRRFEADHRAAGWSGEPAGYGEGAAILLGDLCLSWADTMLLGSGLDHDALARGKPVYDLMRTELMAGQYLDLLEQARRNTSLEAALRVATYKSAAYTIQRPLHLGAVLGGAEPELVEALGGYGSALGQAFQLRDDLLGVFGDPATTGKPAGDDLREGKRTALVVLAIERSAAADREVLQAGLGDRGASDDVVRSMTRIIAGTGARDEVERFITEQAGVAAARLAATPMPDEPRQVLQRLISTATDRIA